MRVSNWPAQLHARVEFARNKPFDWANWHCCMFVDECVRAVTGYGLPEEAREPYGGPLAAARAMPGGIKAAMTASLGEPVAVSLAQRGDVVLYAGNEEHARWPIAGICLGEMSAFTAQGGLQQLQTKDCLCAWHVA